MKEKKSRLEDGGVKTWQARMGRGSRRAGAGDGSDARIKEGARGRPPPVTSLAARPRMDSDHRRCLCLLVQWPHMAPPCADSPASFSADPLPPLAVAAAPEGGGGEGPAAVGGGGGGSGAPRSCSCTRPQSACTYSSTASTISGGCGVGGDGYGGCTGSAGGCGGCIGAVDGSAACDCDAAEPGDC